MRVASDLLDFVRIVSYTKQVGISIAAYPVECINNTHRMSKKDLWILSKGDLSENKPSTANQENKEL